MSTPTIPQSGESPQPGALDAAKEEAANVAERAKEESSRVLEEARRTLRSQSEEQAQRLASGAHDVARQLDELASGRGGTDGPIADLAHEAAARIAALADRLDADGIAGITGDVKQFARRHPGTYLVGAFALGIAAGRVFRNADTAALSQAARPDRDGPTDHDGLSLPAPGAEYGEAMLGDDELEQLEPSPAGTRSPSTDPSIQEDLS